MQVPDPALHSRLLLARQGSTESDPGRFLETKSSIFPQDLEIKVDFSPSFMGRESSALTCCNSTVNE